MVHVGSTVVDDNPEVAMFVSDVPRPVRPYNLVFDWTMRVT